MDFASSVGVRVGMEWRISLRHCATNRKVAVSIPGWAVGLLHWHIPSNRTIAQPLQEISTRNISWRVKAAGA